MIFAGVSLLLGMVHANYLELGHTQYFEIPVYLKKN